MTENASLFLQPTNSQRFSNLNVKCRRMLKNQLPRQWETIADKLSKAGFSVGWVSAFDDYGRTVWIVDAHRDGKRFVVRADEILTAFVELEREVLTVTFYLESIQ